MEQVNGLGFLLGDKKAGPFKLEVEWMDDIRIRFSRGAEDRTLLHYSRMQANIGNQRGGIPAAWAKSRGIHAEHR
jgi:hypothetical protein